MVWPRILKDVILLYCDVGTFCSSNCRDLEIFHSISTIIQRTFQQPSHVSTKVSLQDCDNLKTAHFHLFPPENIMIFNAYYNHVCDSLHHTRHLCEQNERIRYHEFDKYIYITILIVGLHTKTNIAGKSLKDDRQFLISKYADVYYIIYIYIYYRVQFK